MSELIQSVQENLSFLAVCLLVFLGLYLVAWLFERYVLKTVKKVTPARRISYIAMFTVIAAVLMFFEIPLFFAPSFYEIDFSEVPVMILLHHILVCSLTERHLQLLWPLQLLSYKEFSS